VTQSTTFPLFDKVAVNGPNAHEVFKFLRFHSELNNGDSVGHIHWNFGKFLVDPATMAVHYFNPREDPQNIEFAVATCLQ
jgi:glutathione peroxidase